MPNEEFGGGPGSSNNNNNDGNNTVDPGDDTQKFSGTVERKILPSSHDGRCYSSKPQTNTWIVIHNVGGGGADSCYNTFSGKNERNVSTHYTCDATKVIQMLENNWKGHHVNGGSHCAEWPDAFTSGATNSNSIGIEIGDKGSDEDCLKAMEMGIELCRYLMKEMNISIDHVVRHGDCQNKSCPNKIMALGKWNYFKEQCVSRNESNKPITFDSNKLSTPNGGDGSPSSGYNGNANFVDIIPNVDHRYNIANMDQVTGACLIFLPPYNVCTLDQQTEHFTTWGWDRKYHYILDPLYDIDANPDDDIPDLTNAKGLDEMNNSSSDNSSSDSSNNDSNNDSDYADPDELPEDNRPRTIQPRAQLTENDFSAASFIGDSLTVGLGQAVNGINTFATVGQTVGKGRVEHVQGVINTGSKVVIISYGTNDAGYKDTSGFITNYKNLINDIKNGIPGVTIFVNKIFPGDASKANSNGKACIENIPAHNDALNQICSDTGAFLIDCTGIPNLMSYYSNDGIHFKSEFYKLWYEDMKSKVLNHTGGNTNGNNPSGVAGPKAEEDNSIIVKGGFLIETSRLLQCYGLEDNDRVTYINRALYKGKPTAHCLMIACFIPTYTELVNLNVDYTKVEKNIINSVSKILWANGLEAKDLWREFDMNRSPSPANYLERDLWKDLLFEIDKQIVWRNKKFGKVVTKYEKYIATIPDQTVPDTSNGGGSSPGGATPGDDIGGISDTAQAVWVFLTSRGYTPECAAGILGNMEQESGVDPKAIQGNGKGPAAGICQWENYNKQSARWKAMSDYASSKGKNWTDLQSQLEWLDLELQGKDSTTLSLLKKKVGGYEQFKALTDVDKACLVFEESFERAGKPNMPRRYEAAKKYYDQFKNSSNSKARTITEPVTKTVQSRTAQFSWPTPGITEVTSKFGPRKPPCKGASSNHGGIDISAPMNTDVHATAGGTVTFYGFHKSAGNYMVIDHGNGWGSRYLHLTKNVVNKGDTVTANQVIAKSGNTGIGTGAHLHFEIHKDFPSGGTSGTKVDPLLYVNPGETVDNPGNPSTGNPTTPGDSSGSYSGPVINTIWGEIENPGPAANLPYNGNSMGGLEHDDWGGKMSYYIDDPEDSLAEKPEIASVLSTAEYSLFCETYFVGESYNEDGSITPTTDFNRFWELIDILAGETEPYDKGLVNAADAAITPNDRLQALTTNFTTDNENVFHFNILESGPGSKDHCVKAADELNFIVVPKDLKVEPIYPDLIIPPQYTTSNLDEQCNNAIPITVIETINNADSFSKQLTLNYDLLKDKKKESNKCLGPINFMDPYPTDDKIEELEQHFPKVFIDEIESQLYSCNHPGCPIGQPMAKNFAMLTDALMNQSKRTEKRLVRLENILSTIMRNQARLSSRININCVYYGGQSTYAGKYKCIRCMHDDRIHDGAIVTLDQCLNCTRYEPILGQIYQILDESGFNGSVVLDDMQMSYSNLETYKRLNTQIDRTQTYNYVEVTKDEVGLKPEKTRIDIWKEANKEEYLKNKPEQSPDNINTENRAEDTGNEATYNKQLEEANEPNYIFRMDWNETYLNTQQPDTKQYPTEGIIMRFKKQEGDFSFNEEINELDPEKDKDTIEDLQKQLKLVNGQWTDTREKAETVQVNKYSSEKFYFEGFSEIKQTNGIGSSSGGNGGLGAECRAKIIEMANTIVQECTDGKAWYSQTNRTVDYNNPGYHNGKKAYDCSGFVSCCYLNAGLKSMYAKACSGGTLMDEIVNNGGEMWLMDDAGFEKAKPGDVLVVATRTVSESDMGTKIPIEHAIIYMGDKTIAHARNSKKGIVKEPIEDWRIRDKNHVFVRPKDLIEADKAAASSGGSSGGVTEDPGSVDGKNYIARILGAVCTSYTGSGAGASGMGCEYNKTCASHNMPYGTKIYIPQLADKLGGDGVLTVTDTGGPLFDFDIFTTSNVGKVNADVYVLEWGTGAVAKGYQYFIDYYLKNGQWSKYKSAWNKYKEMGGKLITFTKFSQDDSNIKNHPNYNDK